jgi:hypothetical protein
MASKKRKAFDVKSESWPITTEVQWECLQKLLANTYWLGDYLEADEEKQFLKLVSKRVQLPCIDDACLKWKNAVFVRYLEMVVSSLDHFLDQDTKIVKTSGFASTCLEFWLAFVDFLSEVYPPNMRERFNKGWLNAIDSLKRRISMVPVEGEFEEYQALVKESIQEALQSHPNMGVKFWEWLHLHPKKEAIIFADFPINEFEMNEHMVPILRELLKTPDRLEKLRDKFYPKKQLLEIMRELDIKHKDLVQFCNTQSEWQLDDLDETARDARRSMLRDLCVHSEFFPCLEEISFPKLYSPGDPHHPKGPRLPGVGFRETAHHFAQKVKRQR